MSAGVETGALAHRFRRLARTRGAGTSLLVILALVALALLAPVLAPFDPIEQHVTLTLAPPSLAHPFGTDAYGRDVLSRMIYGSRPALVVGLCSVLLAVAIGTPLGMLAGFAGGALDALVNGIVEIMLSFPSLLLALMVVTLAGSGLGVVVAAIGFAQIPIFVRLARGSTLVVREQDYVAASRSFGAGLARILLRHILPNILGPIIVMGTLGIASAIREEAGLSFLGLGIEPPAPSWGNLVRDGVANILDAPWLALLPGLVLTLSVLAFNLLGDAARDLLDPRDIAGRAARTGKAR